MKNNKNKHLGFRVLSSEIELHTAALDRQVVLVFVDQELIGSGTVEEIDGDYIKIKGEWYVRSQNTFTLPG